MAEAMKARIMARVEAANIEAAQGSSLQTSQEAAAANAAAKASEEKEAVEMAKARARAEEEARKHKAEDAERSRNYQHAQDTAEASALRLRHEKESKQLAQANLAHKAKTAQRGIATASVVLSPYDQLQLVMGEDSDPEEAAPEALAPRAKKAAMRGTSKKGVAFVNAPVEKKKDVAYYRAEIAAAEILGKHKTAEALYNEARALGFELPHWRSDGARARQLSARTVPVKDLTPAQYAKQEMDLDNNEDSESSRRAEPEPEPAPAAPVVQLMDRPQGSSEPIEAAIEELGSTITIRLQHARYDTKLGEPWRTTTKAVDGTLEIQSSKKESLVLHFSSTDRTKGNLKGKLTTPPRKPPRGSQQDGSESESSDEDDDLYAKDLVLAEFYREGARVHAGVPKTGGGKNLCEVTVGGIVHGSIPGGDSLPEFRRTIQHLSDRSFKDGDNGVMTARSEGGVTLVQGCICCPCQTQKNQLLVSGKKSARSPGKALTELDASLYSVQDGCGTCRMDARKMVCKLPGNAHARLEIVIMFAYMAASLLTLPPK